MRAYIGDVHGRFQWLLPLVDRLVQMGVTEVVQVGDFGYWPDPLFHNDFGIDISFIDGNHEHHDLLDSPLSVERLKGYNLKHIKRGTVIGSTIYLGGGTSRDRAARVLGYDWFPQESLQQSHYYESLKYQGVVDTVVAHDMPIALYSEFYGDDYDAKDKTANVLNGIVNVLKPKLYICGHHHRRASMSVDGTQYEVLDMLRGGYSIEDMIANCVYLTD